MSSSIAMAADSTQSDSKVEGKAGKKKKDGITKKKEKAKERKGKKSVAKKIKAVKKKTGQDELDNDSGNDSDLDLSKDVKPILKYIKDRKEMVNQMFRSLRENKLRAMLPEILQPLSVEELRVLCLEHLNVMSKKRISRIVDGADPETISSSGTEDENSDEEAVGESFPIAENSEGESEQGHAADSTSQTNDQGDQFQTVEETSEQYEHSEYNEYNNEYNDDHDESDESSEHMSRTYSEYTSPERTRSENFSPALVDSVDEIQEIVSFPNTEKLKQKKRRRLKPKCDEEREEGELEDDSFETLDADEIEELEPCEMNEETTDEAVDHVDHIAGEKPEEHERCVDEETKEDTNICDTSGDIDIDHDDLEESNMSILSSQEVWKVIPKKPASTVKKPCDTEDDRDMCTDPEEVYTSESNPQEVKADSPQFLTLKVDDADMASLCGSEEGEIIEFVPCSDTEGPAVQGVISEESSQESVIEVESSEQPCDEERQSQCAIVSTDDCVNEQIDEHDEACQNVSEIQLTLTKTAVTGRRRLLIRQRLQEKANLSVNSNAVVQDNIKQNIENETNNTGSAAEVNMVPNLPLPVNKIQTVGDHGDRTKPNPVFLKRRVVSDSNAGVYATQNVIKADSTRKVVASVLEQKATTKNLGIHSGLHCVKDKGGRTCQSERKVTFRKQASDPTYPKYQDCVQQINKTGITAGLHPSRTVVSSASLGRTVICHDEPVVDLSSRKVVNVQRPSISGVASTIGSRQISSIPQSEVPTNQQERRTVVSPTSASSGPLKRPSPGSISSTNAVVSKRPAIIKRAKIIPGRSAGADKIRYVEIGQSVDMKSGPKPAPTKTTSVSVGQRSVTLKSKSGAKNMKTIISTPKSAHRVVKEPQKSDGGESGVPFLSKTQMEILELEMRARAIKAMLMAHEDDKDMLFKKRKQ